MIIKVRKGLVIKPRICPDCGRFCLFAPHPLSIHCKYCSERKNRHKKHLKYRQKRKLLIRNKDYKYDNAYQKARKKAIRDHPYCALCGSTQDLTTHHIGGGSDNSKLTVLCYECHQAYEAWNQRRQKCTTKRGIKRTMSFTRLLIWHKLNMSKN